MADLVYIGGRLVSQAQERERQRIEAELSGVEHDIMATRAALEQQREAIDEAAWRLRKHLQQRAMLSGKVIYKVRENALLRR
jgi:uncharacterized protein YicC (UPF0701 family)